MPALLWPKIPKPIANSSAGSPSRLSKVAKARRPLSLAAAISSPLASMPNPRPLTSFSFLTRPESSQALIDVGAVGFPVVAGTEANYANPAFESIAASMAEGTSFLNFLDQQFLPPLGQCGERGSAGPLCRALPVQRMLPTTSRKMHRIISTSSWYSYR